jgi:hypothetical protein
VPAGIPRRLLSSEIAIRFALVAVAVGVCYLFEWRWLRWLTAELNVRLDALAGVHLERVSPDEVMWRGALYKYVVACTFADVWCGAIPLLWGVQHSVRRNVGVLLGFAAALVCFNAVRLSFSDVMFAAGVAWDLAHNVVSGVCYFVIWTWIWNHRPWAGTRDRVLLHVPSTDRHCRSVP